MLHIEVGAVAGLWPLGSFALSAAACAGQINDIIADLVLPMGGLLCCTDAVTKQAWPPNCQLLWRKLLSQSIWPSYAQLDSRVKTCPLCGAVQIHQPALLQGSQLRTQPVQGLWAELWITSKPQGTSDCCTTCR